MPLTCTRLLPAAFRCTTCETKRHAPPRQHVPFRELLSRVHVNPEGSLLSSKLVMSTHANTVDKCSWRPSVPTCIVYPTVQPSCIGPFYTFFHARLHLTMTFHSVHDNYRSLSGRNVALWSNYPVQDAGCCTRRDPLLPARGHLCITHVVIQEGMSYMGRSPTSVYPNC